MLSTRIATIEQDAGCLAEHNCAMAYETEGKILDRDQVTKGVCGLFERPQFGFYLVAEDHGLVVASLMVTYEWSDWRNGLFWWIQSVYVNKTHRRQGISIEACEDCAYTHRLCSGPFGEETGQDDELETRGGSSQDILQCDGGSGTAAVNTDRGSDQGFE